MTAIILHHFPPTEATAAGKDYTDVVAANRRAMAEIERLTKGLLEVRTTTPAVNEEVERLKAENSRLVGAMDNFIKMARHAEDETSEARAKASGECGQLARAEAAAAEQNVAMYKPLDPMKLRLATKASAFTDFAFRLQSLAQEGRDDDRES